MQIPAKLRVSLGTLVFAFVVYHCFFTGLDRFGFVGPDEPRYASIAREMARSDDWVTPRLNGTPWFEKPPLYYWSAAIGFRMFASPEIAARAPSGVLALCAVLALMLCARRLYGSASAFAVGMMLPATVAMTGFARAAATDMPFAACLTIAIAAAAYLLLEDSPAYRSAFSAAFGVALSLAVLAKGPAAILLAGGSVGLWAITTGNMRRSFRLFHPTATLSFVAVALPWYAVCAARNPEFLRIFFLEHNVERFLTNRYQHQQPFWFFLPVLLLAVFPWTLLLIPALTDGWRAMRSADWRKSPSAFFAAWVLFPLFFFSASQSKLPGYILPAAPPLVLLLARALTEGYDPALSKPRKRLLWASIPLAVAGIAAIYVVAPTTHLRIQRLWSTIPGFFEPMTFLGISLLIGAAVVAGVSCLRSIGLSTAIAAFLFSFTVGVAANHVLPLLDREISARQISLDVLRRSADAPIAVHDLPRAWHYGAEFYLDRPLPEWNSAMPYPISVITSERGIKDLPIGAVHNRRLEFYGPATFYRVE